MSRKASGPRAEIEEGRRTARRCRAKKGGSPGWVSVVWRHSSVIATGSRNGSKGGLDRDPGGGPESRLWAAVVERVQGSTNSSTRRRISLRLSWWRSWGGRWGCCGEKCRRIRGRGLFGLASRLRSKEYRERFSGDRAEISEWVWVFFRGKSGCHPMSLGR
jgi:hypothetical protein